MQYSQETLSPPSFCFHLLFVVAIIQMNSDDKASKYQKQEMYGQPMYGQHMYGQQPPMMMAQPMYAPPPPPQQGPMIITVGGNNNDNSGSPCPACGKDTGQIPRKKIGCVTILWCLCLLFFTGGMFWCYPFCVDSCKDTELICVKCHTVKSKIEANCC